eukprot:2404431-Ditylum_brightwellii.AAC.1
MMAPEGRMLLPKVLLLVVPSLVVLLLQMKTEEKHFAASILAWISLVDNFLAFFTKMNTVAFFPMLIHER